MSRIESVSRLVTNFVGVLSALGIIVMMLHITLDVAARLVFGSPLIGTNEIVSRYYMVAVAFLPLAWVEHHNAMISVELFDTFLGRRTLLISDLAVALVSAVALILVAWTSFGEAIEAVGKGAFVMAVGTRIEVWPTYFIIPIGCFLAAGLVVLKVVLWPRRYGNAKDRS